MPTTYAKADTLAKECVSRVIAEHYQDFVAAEVTIDVLYAFADPEGDKPAIEKRGHRQLAEVRILSLRDRVKGHADAEITLDGDAWANMPNERREAIVDHELYHIELRRDKEGTVLTDDHSRPQMKMRNHDREMGWFDIIAKRHGSASGEVQQLKALFDENGQTYLPYILPTNELIDSK
jgi:hypothetical protein